jgi:CheY-like chemotaxis protein
MDDQKIIGIVDCPSLKMYADFLLRRGFTVLLFKNGPVASSSLLLFCKDHLSDPAIAQVGKEFGGPKLVLNEESPSGWINAHRVSLPLLPLDLENQILKLLDQGLSSPQSSHRILVVEDDVTVAMTLVRTFQEGGFQVRVCRGFAEMAAGLQHQPELIIMDLNLPGLSGEKLGEMLKKQKIPVVIFSSETEERLQEAKKKISAVAAFPKDVPQRTMREWIRNYLEKQ